MGQIETRPGAAVDVDLGHGVHLHGVNTWHAMSDGARWCETRTMLRVLADADETRGK